MVDQFIGLILLGLGLTSPATPPSIKGDSTEVSGQTSGSGGSDGAISVAPQPFPPGTPVNGDKEHRDRQMPTTRDFRGGMKDLRDMSRYHTASMNLGFKQRADNLREFFQNQEDTFTEKTKENRRKEMELWKEHEASFSAQLELIKDQRKKTLVSQIDQNLSLINTKRTDVMTKQVNTITQILQNIIARAAEANAKGLDVSAVDSAITAAQTAIAAAQAAVSAQAAKTYSITINSESTVGSDIATVRKALRTDLEATFAKVKDAHAAVRAAGEALGKALGNVPTTPSATSSTSLNTTQ